MFALTNAIYATGYYNVVSHNESALILVEACTIPIDFVSTQKQLTSHVQTFLIRDSGQATSSQLTITLWKTASYYGQTEIHTHGQFMSNMV